MVATCRDWLQWDWRLTHARAPVTRRLGFSCPPQPPGTGQLGSRQGCSHCTVGVRLHSRGTLRGALNTRTCRKIIQPPGHPVIFTATNQASLSSSTNMCPVCSPPHIITPPRLYPRISHLSRSTASYVLMCKYHPSSQEEKKPPKMSTQKSTQKSPPKEEKKKTKTSNPKKINRSPLPKSILHPPSKFIAPHSTPSSSQPPSPPPPNPL